MIEILAPAFQAEITTELKELFIKIFFPALFVVTAAILYNAKRRRKQTILTVLSSYVSALAVTYAMRHVIITYLPPDTVPVASGLLALSSEKIIGYVIDTFKVEEWLKLFFNFFFSNKKNNV